MGESANVEPLLWLPSLALALGLLGCGATSEPPEPTQNEFVHVDRGQVVDRAGEPLWLEGMMFGDFWEQRPDPPREAHAEEDYARAAAMGVNYVRLFLNSELLEDATGSGEIKPGAFAWLDDNVAWARAQGLYLIPALSNPPGGSPLDCASDRFWDEPEYQDRMVTIWRAIAERYANEPVIGGYALLDTPNPSQSLAQWQTLAERLTKAIREVDPMHMLILGRAVSIACVFDKSAADTFPRLEDPNVLYEFDRLQPWEYVSQKLDNPNHPESGPNPDYGPYPDPTRFSIKWEPVPPWLHASEDGQPGHEALKLKPDETEWTEKRFFYTVTDPKFEFAQPALQSNYNSGKVFFDDIAVYEVDASGNRVRTVFEADIETAAPWYFYEGDAFGNQLDGTGVVEMVEDPHRGNLSITLSGTSTQANLGGGAWAFLVTVGQTYEMTGWMKGEHSDPDGVSLIRLDFYGYESELHGFDRGFVSSLFSDFVDWGRNEGVPLNVTLGTGRPTFEDGLGGLQWVSDMLDIAREQKLHFAYYGYHQPDWGIYSNPVGLPDPETVNQPLVDLLTEKLR